MAIKTVTQAAFLQVLEEGAEYLGVVSYAGKIYVHARIGTLDQGDQRMQVVRAEVQG